ncbi:hypothetical protein ACIBSV_28840 [Embleya sp. NPDC050154]|uniref:hypothetical protein n=1 Tax=Embleya sp. NPDC050154 TaxID=3363988 RepID=UPI00378F6CBB
MDEMEVVLVGPVTAVARVCVRLRETGDLVAADRIVSAEEDPGFGSCRVRMTVPGRAATDPEPPPSRGASIGLFTAMAAYLGNPAQCRRGSGRHRAPPRA